jgi:nicotinamide phosphoribosyltransferase
MNTIKFKPEYVQNLTENVLLDADSYKCSHFAFLEEGTTNISAYIEGRTGAKNDSLTIAGIQAFNKRYMMKPITQFMIDQAEWFITTHGEPFNREGWEYVLHAHNGYMPVVINSAEEGTTIPISCPYITVENTDKNPLAAWCAPYIETKLMRTWAPIAVATQSNSVRKLILEYLEKTGTPELIDYKMVDFGARGVSSKETAEILGAAHLTSFRSTDNMLGIAHAMTYYNSSEMLGESIPATEHSVTTARGEEGELQFYLDIVDRFLGEGKMVSVVADTYDLDAMLDMLGTKIKPFLLAKGGTWVVRPDSGDPVLQVMGTIRKLDQYFGHTVNAKEYKVLHNAVRIIQGDGVDYATIRRICVALDTAGYSIDNITFGSGGWLLQSLNRDTNRTAMKASYVEVGEKHLEIRKVVKTDPTKASKAGRITTVLRDGKKICVKEHEILPTDKNLLKPTYHNGRLYNHIDFPTVRANIKAEK